MKITFFAKDLYLCHLSKTERDFAIQSSRLAKKIQKRKIIRIKAKYSILGKKKIPKIIMWG